MASDSRHPSTEHMTRVLTPNPNLPEGAPATVSGIIWDTYCQMLALLGDGPEFSTGARKLREAKDCFVLQAVFDQQDQA